MIEEQKKFVAAVQHCVKTFHQPKHKKKFRNESPRFWCALLDLEQSCKEENWKLLCKAFKECYRYLGAPGDFGYGTPCGDALRDVYDRWNDLCNAKSQKKKLATAAT